MVLRAGGAAGTTDDGGAFPGAGGGGAAAHKPDSWLISVEQIPDIENHVFPEYMTAVTVEAEPLSN